MEIQLTQIEYLIASQVAAVRHTEAIRQGLRNQHGALDENGHSLHVIGALGEIAFCKAVNLYWGGDVNTFKQADVGRNIQVRTRSRSDYDMIVRQHDSDADVFVLVIGVDLVYNVIGWILGAEAKRQEWMRDYGGRPPAYFVPQAALHSIETLRQVTSQPPKQAVIF